MNVCTEFEPNMHTVGPPGLSTLSDSVRSLRVRKWTKTLTHATSATRAAIAIYDVTLTFSREVEIIWKRKPTLITWVYLLSRYVNIVSYALIPWYPMNTRVREHTILPLMLMSCINSCADVSSCNVFR